MSEETPRVVITVYLDDVEPAMRAMFPYSWWSERRRLKLAEQVEGVLVRMSIRGYRPSGRSVFQETMREMES